MGNWIARVSRQPLINSVVCLSFVNQAAWQRPMSSEDCADDFQSSISTLPRNLCVRWTEHPEGRYGVWALNDIPLKTRFGPYRGLYNSSNNHMKGSGFQWKVEMKDKEKVTLDGWNEMLSNWLRYINYACNKNEQNMVAVQTNLEVFYVTSKPIPSNSELLVWYCEEGNEIHEGANRKEKKLAKMVHKCAGNNKIDNERRDLHQSSHSFSEADGSLPTVQTDRVSYICRFCGKQLTTKIALIMHAKIHTDNAYLCGTCGQTFLSLDILKAHERCHNMRKKTSEHRICWKKLSAKWKLSVHERIHPDEMQFECNVCGKMVSSMWRLEEHKVTHTDEGCYECSTCGRIFKKIGWRDLHERAHKDKSYRCSGCGKRFGLKKKFIYHKMNCWRVNCRIKQRRFKCRICGKRFIHKGHLSLHETYHTSSNDQESGSQSYECVECRKTFSNKRGLVAHQRCHVGKNPYECNICGEKFKMAALLESHEAHHSNEK